MFSLDVHGFRVSGESKAERLYTKPDSYEFCVFIHKRDRAHAEGGRNGNRKPTWNPTSLVEFVNKVVKFHRQT